MNLKLIITLSLFGLAMAITTVFFIPFNVEYAFWLPIFIVSAYFIAKRAPGKYFLHGFLTSLANCVWVTCAHILLFSRYLATHAQEMEINNKMPILHGHPRQQMLIMGPMFGVVFGLILGLFAFVASKIVKKA